MAKELIIGRGSQSPVPIPADKVEVSGSHVKIKIDDNGRWEIEDLDSPNGTFIKDGNGIFQRVFKKNISEDTVIRLGQEGNKSYVFMAHRAISPDDTYEYEFRRLKKLLKNQIEEEEALEIRNARNMNIVKASAPLALGLCIAAQYIIPGLKNNSDANLWISRIAMAVAPVAIGMFFGIDTKSIKALKQKRQRVLTCPKCGYPVSEFDINNMQCSRCKAK